MVAAARDVCVMLVAGVVDRDGSSPSGCPSGCPSGRVVVTLRRAKRGLLLPSAASARPAYGELGDRLVCEPGVRVRAVSLIAVVVFAPRQVRTHDVGFVQLRRLRLDRAFGSGDSRGYLGGYRRLETLDRGVRVQLKCGVQHGIFEIRSLVIVMRHVCTRTVRWGVHRAAVEGALCISPRQPGSLSAGGENLSSAASGWLWKVRTPSAVGKPVRGVTLERVVRGLGHATQCVVVEPAAQ